MKRLILASSILFCGTTFADCPSSLPLKGISTVEDCRANSKNCVEAGAALREYMDARADDAPELLTIGLHGSPWHLYDADDRIMEIGDLAQLVKDQGPQIKRVELLSSWSGVAPDVHHQSLAAQLSRALGNMPVTGQDGFVWYASDGHTETTHQAFTMRAGAGRYLVKPGEKVMASLVVGWPLELEPEILKRQDGQGMLFEGAAYDVFLLCPERSLVAYEKGASFSNAVATYNAAIMHLERNEPGDKAVALALLKQAASAGDTKASEKLRALAR